jgi:hypothetical protein
VITGLNDRVERNRSLRRLLLLHHIEGRGQIREFRTRGIYEIERDSTGLEEHGGNVRGGKNNWRQTRENGEKKLGQSGSVISTCQLTTRV